MKQKLLLLGCLILLFIPFAFATEGYGTSTYGNSTYGNITTTTSSTPAAAAVTFSTNPAASSITGTSVTLTATTSIAATCKYASSASVGYGDMAAFGSTGGTTHSSSVTSLVAGSGYTYTVTCRDSNSNDVSNTVSFTTTATPSSGGGSGGSGGGTAAAAFIGQVHKEVWTSVKAGETATMKVENGALGISQVSFNADQDTYGIWLEVEGVDNLPDDVRSYSGQVYKKVKITGNNLEKLITETSKATVKFTVKKEWLTENKIDKNNMALFRHVDTKWFELTTTMDSDDGTYVHYTALTPGFSYFVIGEKFGSAAAMETTKAVTGEAIASEKEVTSTTTGIKAITTQPSWLSNLKKKVLNIKLWIIPIITVLAIVIFLIVYKLTRKEAVKSKRVVVIKKKIKAKKLKRKHHKVKRKK